MLPMIAKKTFYTHTNKKMILHICDGTITCAESPGSEQYEKIV
jgi:hypothetical protein